MHVRSGSMGVAAILLAGALPTRAPAGTTWHVDDDAPAGGNGIAWASAFRELAEALGAARAGDEIRVAGGTYRPDYDAAARGHTGDRGASFGLPAGVALAGGYAGYFALDSNFRDPGLHVTVLSGDLAGDDAPGCANTAENSYHVVRAGGAGPAARLDGLTISGGNADGKGPPAMCFGGPDPGAPCTPQEGACEGAPCVSFDGVGGGIICQGGSLAVSGCRITSNFAAFLGAGMFLGDGSDLEIAGSVLSGNRALDSGGAIHAAAVSPVVVDCTFEANSAGRYGGAISFRDVPAAVLVSCTFAVNTAAEGESAGGGAIANAASSPLVIGCAFDGNRSFMGRGGAVHNTTGFDPARGGSDAAFSGCAFTGNIAMTGGAVFQELSGGSYSGCTFSGNDATAGRGGGGLWDEGGSPLITGCSFTDNAGFNGGGLYFGNHSAAVIEGCTFVGNVSVNDNGGGMSNVESDVLVTDCTFIGNSATGKGFVVGGGVSNYISSPAFSGCTFVGNTAVFGGGGLYNENGGAGGPTVTRCTFLDNSAPSGGGMYNFLSSPVVTDCLFAGNSAPGGRGGAIDNDFDSSPVIRHCTITGNSAQGGQGGGLNNENVTGAPAVSHSIVWGNTPDQIADDARTPSTVSWSDIQGGWTGAGGGNIDADPGFEGPAAGDFRLRPGSPCVDAGDPAFTAAPGETDLAGLPRVAAGVPGGLARVDLGAHELQSGCPGDLDGDGLVGAPDLVALLRDWGPGRGGRADLDGDGAAGPSDLVILLANWGPCR